MEEQSNTNSNQPSIHPDFFKPLFKPLAVLPPDPDEQPTGSENTLSALDKARQRRKNAEEQDRATAGGRTRENNGKKSRGKAAKKGSMQKSVSAKPGTTRKSPRFQNLENSAEEDTSQEEVGTDDDDDDEDYYEEGEEDDIAKNTTEKSPKKKKTVKSTEKKKAVKRPRGAKKLKRKNHITMRCSLKEFFSCVALLKDRHLQKLRKAGLGPMINGKVRENPNHHLACYLMDRIDPDTMELDLGVANKKLEITAYGIHLLLGLPHGPNTAPRPSESGNDEALMELKKELGFKRSQHIKTDDLRNKLKELVGDEKSDDLALRVFVLIMHMKIICPGTSVRVSREARMVKDLVLEDLKDQDLCQLLNSYVSSA